MAGDLDCNGGRFSNPGKIAFKAERIIISGSVFLRDNFIAQGEISLSGAKIAYAFDCGRGSFINKNGVALSIQRAVINQIIFFVRGFTAQGLIDLTQTECSTLMMVG